MQPLQGLHAPDQQHARLSAPTVELSCSVCLQLIITSCSAESTCASTCSPCNWKTCDNNAAIALICWRAASQISGECCADLHEKVFAVVILWKVDSSCSAPELDRCSVIGAAAHELSQGSNMDVGVICQCSVQCWLFCSMVHQACLTRSGLSAGHGCIKAFPDSMRAF